MIRRLRNATADYSHGNYNFTGFSDTRFDRDKQKEFVNQSHNGLKEAGNRHLPENSDLYGKTEKGKVMNLRQENPAGRNEK